MVKINLDAFKALNLFCKNLPIYTVVHKKCVTFIF